MGLVSIDPILKKIQRRKEAWEDRQQLKQLTHQVGEHAPVDPDQRPVVVMNVSSRLRGVSQNAAFTLLAGWGLRLSGIPVVTFACQEGLQPCVLGTNRQDYSVKPPCRGCIAQSRELFEGGETRWFSFHVDQTLQAKLTPLSLNELIDFSTPLTSVAGIEVPMPLGRLVLPAIRWALRRHHLPDDEPTRYLLRQYMLSAASLAEQFAGLIEQVQPQACLIFNGIMYPEAAARWVTQQKNVRVITQEVGFQPFSAFFSDGEATAYPIHIPDDFELSPRQNARLDEYLEKRFKGKFTMAGIRFWPELRPLDETFLEKAPHFRQIVSIFTNVIYDTSQVHANTIFAHMFAWLDQVQAIIRLHPETLFVIRAHPDEMRPGTAKQSRESVQEWVKANHVDQLDNVHFIDSLEYANSYELIQRSKYLMVYNSSIGLEATLLKIPVLCAGKARYTQYPMVYLPSSAEDFSLRAEQMLGAESLEIPVEFVRNARRFLYYQLFKASLSFVDFVKAAGRAGFVHWQPFEWEQLSREHSTVIETLRRGITGQESFLLTENLDD